MLKPFLPQLQTTFTKALNDANRAVRLRAASALGLLSIIHTRIDPLVVDLYNSIKTADDASIRDTALQALRGCINGAGSKLADKTRKDVTALLVTLLSSPDDSTRVTAAACLGSLCPCLPDDELATLMNQHFLGTNMVY
jgi:HEAT repeat protein